MRWMLELQRTKWWLEGCKPGERVRCKKVLLEHSMRLARRGQQRPGLPWSLELLQRTPELEQLWRRYRKSGQEIHIQEYRRMQTRCGPW